MIFRRKKKKVNLDLDLTVAGVTISSIQKTKFLGVFIDPFLTFEAHTQYIRGKIAKGLGILYKCKRFFNTPTLLTLYY